MSCLLGACRQVPGSRVEAIEIWIGRALLHHENFLAEAQQFVEPVCAQLVEALPLHRDFGHARNPTLEGRLRQWNRAITAHPGRAPEHRRQPTQLIPEAKSTT